MRDWEARWVELVAEAEPASAECREDLLKPESMSKALHEDLRAEMKRISGESERWAEGLWSGLARVRKRCQTLSSNAKCTSVDKLRPIIYTVEREIGAFKTQQRQQFDALAAEEFSLEEVLPVLGRRYDAWLAEPSALFKPEEIVASSCSRSRSAGASPSPRNAAPKSEDPELCELKSALETLEAEVKSAGGVSGGWNDHDHEMFLRIARMFKMQASPVFFARLEERFPNFSKSYIADHARWLAENEQRQATKRRLLSRWRDRRIEIEREATEALDMATLEESERKRQASKREQRQRNETKQKLLEWRGRKEAQEEHLAERQRREEEAQARHEREQKRHHQEQRELVEFHRKRREADKKLRQEEEKANQTHTARSRALSQDDKQRIARRSMDVLRRKLQAQGGATPRASTRSPSPMASRQRSVYDHVESRLYDTTESFIGKVKSEPLTTEDSELLATTERTWMGHLRGSPTAPARCQPRNW